MLTDCARYYQIECCIDEWSTGTCQQSNWTEERYKAVYLSHLNSLYDLNSLGPPQIGRDLLAQIRLDLLKNARSVSLLPILASLL
jgi:uncharacterized protein DUF6532